MKQNQMPKKKINFSLLGRVLKLLFKFYPKLVPIIIACIIFSAVTASIPALFVQNIISDIEAWMESGDWSGAAKVIIPKVLILVGIYLVSLSAIILQTQLMAYLTQGFLSKMRCVRRMDLQTR